MLHVLKTTEPATSLTQPENANRPLATALDTFSTDNVYAVSVGIGIPVFYLRASVVAGKVALWLDHGGTEKPFGEPDTLEITGPPGLLGAKLRIRDFTIGSDMYKVSATIDSGSVTGTWERYAEGTEAGVEFVLPAPSSSGEENRIKFTVAAEPPPGLPTPVPLDPNGVIKKEG